jgi:GMP synthase-like glutamine amidotransferase
MSMNNTVLKNGSGEINLPSFFKNGFAVVCHGNDVYTNAPGFNTLADFPTDGDKPVTHKLARFLITHYHPEAAHSETLVEEFCAEFITPLVAEGGLVPHNTVKDWLYYHDQKNELVGSE